MKLREKLNKFIQYFITGLFAVASLMLSVFSAISFVYGIILILNKTGLTGAGNGVEALGKTITVVMIVLSAILVLGVLVAFVYLLVKLSLRYFKGIDNNNIDYFVLKNRYIDAIFAAVLSVFSYFAFGQFIAKVIPWFNNTLAIIMSASYMLIALITFVLWLYLKLWYNKQSDEFKEKYISILNEIEDKRLEKKNLNKNKEELQEEKSEQEEVVNEGEVEEILPEISMENEENTNENNE